MDNRNYNVTQRQLQVPQRGQISAVPSRSDLKATTSNAASPVNTQSSPTFQMRSKQVNATAVQQPAMPKANFAQKTVNPQRVTMDSIAAEQRQMPTQPTQQMRSMVAAPRTQTKPSQVQQVLANAQPKPSRLAKLSDNFTQKKVAILAAANSSTAAGLSSLSDKFSGATQGLRTKLTQVKENTNMQNVLRYGLVTACLLVAGFLAYDTWKTNQQIQQVYSNEPVASAAPVEVQPEEPEPEPAEEAAPAPAGNLVRIPSIGVTAPLITVGLTNDNAIDTPASLADVGWYNGSASPGEKGSVFLTGHYNAGGYGVFNNLGNVNAGDEIFIDIDGSTIRYVIARSETVPVSSVNMNQILNGSRDKETLSIMTCAGTYNGQQFTDRTIVYAERA